MSGKAKTFFLIVVAVFFFDRAAKIFVMRYLKEKIEIIPKLLSFNYVINTGAGFGLFKGMTLLLSLISLLVIILIFANIKKILKESYSWIVALILGGAITNLYDRLFFGFVIDFIDFGFWPVFNLADASISIGAIGLIYYLIKDMKK